MRELWNWLLPTLFGCPEVTFWQALGLLALCRILFGGLGFHGSGRSRMRRRMAERWERMTPEERDRFRHGMRGRCGARTDGVVDDLDAVGRSAHRHALSGAHAGRRSTSGRNAASRPMAGRNAHSA